MAQGGVSFKKVKNHCPRVGHDWTKCQGEPCFSMADLDFFFKKRDSDQILGSQKSMAGRDGRGHQVQTSAKEGKS